MRTFPTLGQYVEALSNPQGVFRTLENVQPERNPYKEVKFCAGNFSALFCVQIAQQRCALKCYTRPVERLERLLAQLEHRLEPYGVAGIYLDRELYVYDRLEQGAYYPVVVQPWIEGETLGRYVERLARGDDKMGFTRLLEQFCQLAVWLLSRDFAHGDLKPDNLLVDRHGALRLIDWDGAFLPEFAGESCRLIGSPVYRHPARDEHYFNLHIDDYPLALIAFSLYALSREPKRYLQQRGDRERLVFDATEVLAGGCELFEQVAEEAEVQGHWLGMRLAEMLRSQQPALDELESVFRYACGERTLTLLSGWEVVDDASSVALIRWRGRYGYADLSQGELLVAPVWEDAQPMVPDEEPEVAVVRQKTQWRGLSLKEGVETIYAGYDEVSPFREHRARVRGAGRYVFINERGVVVIPVEYDRATLFRNGWARVQQGEHIFWIDEQGFERKEELKSASPLEKMEKE